MLEGAAPSDPASFGKLYCAGLFLCFIDEGTEISATDVGGDDDAALAIFTADLIRARPELEVGKFT